MEVNGIPVGSAMHIQSEVHPKTENFVLVDVEFAVIVQGDVDGFVAALDHLKAGGGSLAASCNQFAGVEFLSQLGDNFIEISCKKLEEARLPSGTTEIGIQVVPFSCISHKILVNIESQKLLTAAINSELITYFT